jgi:quinol monooxygenase YgiN
VAAVITVVFSPAAESRPEFERLLQELAAFIRSQPPDGMDSMAVLRSDAYILVQARWRSAADQKAFRVSPGGAKIFRAMSDCSVEPPLTYTTSEDIALSYSRAAPPSS